MLWRSRQIAFGRYYSVNRPKKTGKIKDFRFHDLDRDIAVG